MLDTHHIIHVSSSRTVLDTEKDVHSLNHFREDPFCQWYAVVFGHCLDLIYLCLDLAGCKAAKTQINNNSYNSRKKSTGNK